MPAPSFDILDASLDDIYVVGDRRPVDDGAVQRLAQSIRSIGLRTPITIRTAEITDPENGELLTAYALVAGRHRLEAYRSLGFERIPAIVRDCDELDAELWEIAENLHRADLSKEQRDAQIRRFADLLEKKEDLQSRQGVAIESNRADGRGHRPRGIASKVAEQTGLSQRTVERVLRPVGRKIIDVPDEKDWETVEAEQKRKLMQVWNGSSPAVQVWFFDTVRGPSAMDRQGWAA